MKNFILVSTLLLIACLAVAQVPGLQAENSFGGSNVDRAFSIQQTSDGGFIAAGSTRSNDGQVSGNHAAGEPDFWVIKLSKTGTIQWQKPLGGRFDETAFSVQQTADGGYIVAGEASSIDGQVTGNHGMLDFWITKLDGNGTLLWQKALGGSQNDFATSIRQTKDGGYIVAGGTQSEDGDVTGHHGPTITPDYWVVKLDANGDKQWARTYGGSYSDIAMSVIQTKDGGYMVAGNSASKNGDVTNVHDSVYGDAWIIKLDRMGRLQWQKTFGGSDYDQANSIIPVKDGGFIFAGWTRSDNGDVTGSHGNYDVWVVKLDVSGNMQWQKALGGSSGDLAYSIDQTTDNGYIVAGGTNSTDGQVTGLHGIEGKEDFWVVKLDVNGGLQWQETLGGNEFEEARGVDQTKDGGYIVAGSSGFANVNNGDVSGNHGNYDFWITKLSSGEPTVTESNNLIDTHKFSLTISPNPASSSIRADIISEAETVLLSITDGFGQTMIEKNIYVDKRTVRQIFDISGLQTGLYYVTVHAGKEVLSKTFVKE